MMRSMVESFPEDGFIRVPRSMGVMREASGLSIRALRDRDRDLVG